MCYTTVINVNFAVITYNVVIVSYLSILDTRDDADIRFPKLMLIFRNQRDTKLRWLVSENILDDIIFYILMQSCFDSVRLSSLKY
jgi:hypothetical protein